MIRTLARIFLVLASVTITGSVHAASLHGRYFMVVWGYEDNSGAPENAHTFASFYRGDDLARGMNRPLTISWLPASGVVQSGPVVRGRNFSLQETLHIARRNHAHLTAFGPYEVAPDLYRRALNRVQQLNSGRWRYTMMNGPRGAMNCIAAVGGIGGEINTGFDYGFPASQDVVEHLARWIRSYPRVQQAVAARIGLGAISQRGRSTGRDALALSPDSRSSRADEPLFNWLAPDL